jgi:hypothetical protein
MNSRKAELSKEQRKASIAGLCAMAGCAAKASDYIKDESLSVEDVQAKLFAEMCSQCAFFSKFFIAILAFIALT